MTGQNRSGIYVASKTKHAEQWRHYRANGWPINSTWIDEAGPGESGDLNDLWQRCIAEASSAKVLVVYREHDEVLKGAWVEVGAALASGVPVIAVGLTGFTIAHDSRIRHHCHISDAMLLAADIAARPIDRSKLKCEPITAEGIREVVEEEEANGAACGWHPCSGCYETEDGHPVGPYPFSPLLGTAIGAGCHECGGLGARWDHYSARELAEMAKEFDDDRDQAAIDDEAVDAFAKSMKRKLAKARATGRSGWNDRLRCKNTDLSDALRAHVEKGDAVDVANFAMMIHQRYELIAPPAPFAGPQSKRDHEAWSAGWTAGEASGRHLAKLEPPADVKEIPQ